MLDMIALSEFLKKHSIIPNTFIDDFLEMYNPDTIQTDLVINLDHVVKLLNTRKSDLHKTLIASYKRGIDYTIQKSVKKTGKYGGNNYNKIMITPDCFKRLCMRSRSKRAEEVRTYFIQLQSMLVKYKSFIIEGMPF